jgi:hypothetical protein
MWMPIFNQITKFCPGPRVRENFQICEGLLSPLIYFHSGSKPSKHDFFELGVARSRGASHFGGLWEGGVGGCWLVYFRFLGPPGPPRPRKSAISTRPKTHVLKTQVYSKSRSNYELRASKQQNEDGKQQRTSGRFIIHGIFVRGSPRIKPRRETLQGGFCQQKHRRRNTDPKIGPGGKEHRSETQGKPTTNPQNRQKLRDPARS